MDKSILLYGILLQDALLTTYTIISSVLAFDRKSRFLGVQKRFRFAYG